MENAYKNLEKRGGTPAQSYAALEETRTMLLDFEDRSWTKHLNRFCLPSWSMDHKSWKLKSSIKKASLACDSILE